MIRRLRRKLIGVVMLSLTIILIIVVGAIKYSELPADHCAGGSRAGYSAGESGKVSG